MPVDPAGMIGMAKGVFVTINDYRALRKAYPELQELIAAATDALDAFQADWNTLKSYMFLDIGNSQRLDKSEAEIIDRFLSSYRGFLEQFSKTCATKPGPTLHNDLRMGIKAVLGHAGSGVGSLPQQQVTLQTYMSQAQSYHQRTKNLLGTEDASATLDKMHFSRSASFNYREASSERAQASKTSDKQNSSHIEYAAQECTEIDDGSDSNYSATLDNFNLSAAARRTYGAYGVTLELFE